MSVLIYDVGLHDGRDTGHYLREGCRVVAIDANPAMCAAAEVQFRNYIRSGQLKIINRGIAECKDQLKFWVCDDVSEWSSFHREIASRNGARHHSILVDCVPILEILNEFGVPDYMKSLMPLLPVRSAFCKGRAGGRRRCRAKIGMRHAGCAGG